MTVYDWYRNHFTEPVHDDDPLVGKLVRKVEDLGGTVVSSVYHGGQKTFAGFEAAGSNVIHKVTNAATGALTRLEAGAQRGLRAVEGGIQNVLQKVENAGTRAVHDIEAASAKMVHDMNTRMITPAVHAIEQPIENAWHGVERVANTAWQDTRNVVGGFIHGLERPFRIMLYGGMLIGGYWLYRSLEDRREESLIRRESKRRRYR